MKVYVSKESKKKDTKETVAAEAANKTDMP